MVWSRIFFSASSSELKTRAVPLKMLPSFPVILATAPSSAKLPRRIIMCPSFLIGFFSTLYIIGEKLYYAWVIHLDSRDITDKPSFYLALTTVIIGVQMFLAGFIGELVTRNATERNSYNISKKINYND